MSLPFEKIVAEDRNLSYATVQVTMPAGRSAIGNKFGIHTLPGEYSHVEDFGAVGDGVTDDAAALNAAFTRGGNIVFTPGTTYAIKSRLNISQPNTHIIGDGATIKDLGGFSAGAGTNTMVIVGTESVIVGDVNGGTKLAGYSITGITQGAMSVKLSTSGDNVNFAVGDRIIVRSTHLTAFENPTQFEFNEIVNVSGATITLKYPIRIWNAGWSYQIGNIESWFLDNMTIEGLAFSDGPGISGTLFAASFIYHGRFVNLRFLNAHTNNGNFGVYYHWDTVIDHCQSDGGQYGVILAGCDTAWVTNNRVTNCQFGLAVDTPSGWVHLNENIITDCSQFGIYTTVAYYSEVARNIISNCDHYHLYVKNCKYLEIRDNVFSNITDTVTNGQDCIRAFYDSSEIASNTNYQDAYLSITGNTLRGAATGLSGVGLRLAFRTTESSSYINYIVLANNVVPDGIAVPSKSTHITWSE